MAVHCMARRGHVKEGKVGNGSPAACHPSRAGQRRAHLQCTMLRTAPLWVALATRQTTTPSTRPSPTTQWQWHQRRQLQLRAIRAIFARWHPSLTITRAVRSRRGQACLHRHSEDAGLHQRNMDDPVTEHISRYYRVLVTCVCMVCAGLTPPDPRRDPSNP